MLYCQLAKNKIQTIKKHVVLFTQKSMEFVTFDLYNFIIQETQDS